MDLRDYLRVLRRNWPVVLVLAALGVALSGAVTWRATRIYAASVTLVVSSPDGSANASAAYEANLLSQQRVKSYADLVASERVAAGVADQLHLPGGAAAVRSKISAQAVPDTVLLRATVTDPSPERAQLLANAVGDVFSRSVAQIDTPVGTQTPTVRVTVWERAKLPTSPVSPKPVRTITLGLLLGLVLGVGVAALRSRMDTSVGGEEEVRATTGLATLGAIFHDSDGSRRPLISQGSPHAPRAEAFRQLRTNLRFAEIGTRTRSIVVTSSLAGEGKTSTSCNLAITMAQAGSRVVLVEGDLRRPSFADYLGVEAAAGLTSVLIGAARLDDVLQPWGGAGAGAGELGAAGGRFDVLCSGPVPPNPSELLGSAGMTALLAELAARYDMVVLDAPPLLPVTDAAVLAGQVGGVLMVTRARRTRRDQLARATEALRAVDARILGVVLNMVPARRRDAYQYGYAHTAKTGRHAMVPSGRAPAGGRKIVVSAGPAAEPDPAELTVATQRPDPERQPARAPRP